MVAWKSPVHLASVRSTSCWAVHPATMTLVLLIAAFAGGPMGAACLEIQTQSVDVAPLLAGVAADMGCPKCADKDTKICTNATVTCVLNKLLPGRTGYATGRGATGYGEVLIEGVTKMFDTVAQLGVPLSTDDTFVDLGSGRGRMVMQAFFCTPVQKAIGVELVEDRHKAAAGAKKKIDTVIEKSDRLTAMRGSRQLIFASGDARDPLHWVDPTVVVLDSVLFPENLMFDLRSKFISDLQPGALVLTMRQFKGCRDDVLRQIGRFKVNVSWVAEGGNVWIYMRLPNPDLSAASVALMFGASTGFGSCVENARLNNASAGGSLDVRFCILARNESSGSQKVTSIDSVSDWVDQTLRLHPVGTSTAHVMDASCLWRELQHVMMIAEQNTTLEPVSVSTLFQSVPWHMVKDSDGSSALSLAAFRSKTGQEVELLVSAKADVTQRSSGGRTPLHVTRNPKSAEALLAAGADVHAKDDTSSEPIHQVAGRYANADVTAVLLAHRASVGALDGARRTPLHLAAGRREVEAEAVVDLLLKARSDPTQQDFFGLTPLESAQRPEVHAMLEKAANQMKGAEL